MAGGRPAGPGLHERERELTAVDAALDAARAGQGALVLVEGPPGIGKTRLLAEARARAGPAGMRVLSARGAELERSNPYGVMRQLVERPVLGAKDARRTTLLAGAAQHAEQALGPGGRGRADAFAIVDGLYWLAAALAAERPLLMAVDDLHWADPPSVRALAYLAHRLAEHPIALAMAVRPREAEADPSLRDLLAQPAAVVLRPAPLSARASAALLRETMPDAADPALALACHRASGGNPFLLRELSLALATGAAGAGPGRGERVADLRPDAVRRAIGLRLAGMSPDARDVAAAVAVLGDGARPFDAAALARLPEDRARVAADALARAGILDDDLPLRFVHPLVRNAVHAELGPAHRAAMHADAARILAGGDAPSERIGGHLLHAEPAGDPAWAATLLHSGGAALARGAPDAAVPFLRRALAEPPAAELGAEVLIALGLAEFLAAPTDPAGPAHLRAGIEATRDPDRRAATWLLLSRAAMVTASVPAGVAVLEEALRDEPAPSDEARERLRAELVAEAVTHPATATLVDRMAAELGPPHRSPHAERLRLCTLALVETRRVGSASRAIALSRGAVGDGALVARETGDFTPVYQLMQHLAFADALDEARALSRGALAEARARGSTWGVLALLAGEALLAHRAGDVPAAEADARQVLSHPLLMPLGRPFTAAVLLYALVDRGALDEAEAVALETDRASEYARLSHGAWLLIALGRLRRAQGRPEEALENFLEYGRRAAALGWDHPAAAWRAEAAEVLAMMGRRAEASVLATEQLALARRWGAASGIGVALRAAGLAAPPAEGAVIVAEAAATLAGSPARLEHARALVALGSALRRAGRRVEAREALREGIELARRCGALGLAQDGHAELVAAGARPRRLNFSGIESLTASERRICELASRGLRNREIAQMLFLTAKTVENHLGRAYTKLDISSRDQLAGRLAGAEDAALAAASPPPR